MKGNNISPRKAVGDMFLSRVLRCCLREPKGVAQSLAMTASSINGLTVQSAREAGECCSKASFLCPVVSLCK